MLVAALGDIHGNAGALAAVLTAARREKAEALLLTGDFVGYYYRPAEVLSLLDDWPRWAIRGNHEQMLIDSLADPAQLDHCTRKYGSGLREALALAPSRIVELTTLPQTMQVDVDGCRVLLAHGTPWDADEYLYPDAPQSKWDRLSHCAADVVVLGHTHYPLVRRIRNVLVVNPGSVGQPRNRQAGAAWALVDTESRSVQLFNEHYDYAAVAAEARRRDPKLPYLAEVLCRTAQS